MREPIPAPEVHSDPSCTDHPHCPCGRMLVDDGSDTLICEDCGTRVPISAEQPAAATS